MSLCTGCEACANICPHDAIDMKFNWKGFLYPRIDQNKCIDCGVCQRVCPVNKEQSHDFIFKEAAVYIDKNRDYLMRASSGGAFGTMARYVLVNGGVVFGCSMDSEYNITFVSVNNLIDLLNLHGSKYVQAKVGMIYRQVQQVLKSGTLVLFCGCPCHVAALKSYLRKGYDNLITMDLICHGVPSQLYFKSYVTDLLKRKKEISAFRFRYKEDGKDIYNGYCTKDFYMTYFLWGKGYRNSCYNCRYPGAEREGDFTIGDFWNNKKANFPIDVSKGASLIFFNTEKSKELKKLFQENSFFVSVDSFETAMGSDGGQMKHPCKNDLRTNLIYILYKLFGLSGPKLLFYFNTFLFK